jgi:hypothetical protein
MNQKTGLVAAASHGHSTLSLHGSHRDRVADADIRALTEADDLRKAVRRSMTDMNE